MYYNLTELYHVASPLNFSRLDPDYSQQCYDATWTLARGLDAVVKRKMSLQYEQFSSQDFHELLCIQE